MKSRLTLKRERLVELTTSELTGIAGGHAASLFITCPLADCLDPGITDTSCECCTASGSC